MREILKRIREALVNADYFAALRIVEEEISKEWMVCPNKSCTHFGECHHSKDHEKKESCTRINSQCPKCVPVEAKP